MIDYPAEEFPTDFEVSILTSPAGATTALIRMSNGSERRPATLGPVGLSNLDRALDEVAMNGEVSAVILTGHGRTFCAGADLDMLSSPPSVDAAQALSRDGHRVLSRLSTLGIPTVAGINGTALGGGLELALHCTHRIAVDTAAPIGLPEIGLGLIPGWGGATLLPRLLGWESALEIIVDNAVSGKTLSAPEAVSCGLVDSLVTDVVAGGLEFVDALSGFTRTPTTPISGAVPDLIASTLNRYRNRGGNPIDALAHLDQVFTIAQSSEIANGFVAEDYALSTLMLSTEFRRRLYAFRAIGAAVRLPAGTPDVKPRPITKVGVVGAGLMASQIALAFAEGLDVPVVVTDVTQDRLNGALERIDGWLATRVTRASLSDAKRKAIRERIVPTLNFEDFSSCDLVIEAVFEDLEVKRDVLTRLEGVVGLDVILASNTSSLSIDTMSTFVTHGERVAGIHFFNPVAALKLVEVVRGDTVSNETLSTAIDVVRRLRKTPVLVADRPGFVVNRLLSTFLGEALRLVETGVSPSAITEAISPLRLPMSPFALIDLIGYTVTLKMMQSLYNYAPERFYVGEVLTRAIESESGRPIEDVITNGHGTGRSISTSDIHNTITDALAREVRIMMDERVVGSVTDIDVCLITGAGWPNAIGGLTPYLDGCGASARATGQLFHPGENFT